MCAAPRNSANALRWKAPSSGSDHIDPPTLVHARFQLGDRPPTDYWARKERTDRGDHSTAY